MDRLLRLAERYGVVVSVTKLPPGVLAVWVPDLRRIYLDAGLTPMERLASLAHELGHVHRNHPCTRRKDSIINYDHERQADRFAASALIDAKRYAATERVNPDQHAIADELGVPVDLIYVFEEDILTKVRGVTYAHAREGLGQWEHRYEVAS